MASYFSDLYNPTQPAAALAIPHPKHRWGVNNRHYKRCQIILPLTPSPATFTVGDFGRLIPLKSSDHIYDIQYTCIGATACAADLGVRLAGARNDGGVAPGTTPGTLFASALSLAGTIARTGCFLESAVQTDRDRGQAIWEMLALTADPVVELDLIFTCTTTLTVAASTVTVEMFGSFS